MIRMKQHLLLAGLSLVGLACADSGTTSRSAISAAGSSAVAPKSGATTESKATGSGSSSCPSGYTCVDPVKAAPVGGLKIQDAAGQPVPWACSDGKMMLTTCDDADPKASCTGLTAPLCMHIKIAGMDLTTCGQRCMP